jgi:ribosomal protein S18 acetylase RimI-like enzyme
VQSTEQLLPDGVHTPGHTFWTIFQGEAEVATNWLCHRHEPNASFVYAVESHEAFRGKGYGRAAMIVGEHASLAAGDTHIGLNVFGHNDGAIALYKRLGYRPFDDYRSIDL